MSVPDPSTTKWVPLWNTGASSPAGSGMLTGDLIWSVLATRPGSVACDGTLYNSVADNTFAALYAAIGTTYGGTGPTSFAVPDVRGRLLVGRGTNADVNAVGKNDGDANPANRTPLHWHAASGLSWSGSFAGSGGATDVENATHYHGFSANTGYVSADHVHQLWDYVIGYGGTGQGMEYLVKGATGAPMEEPSLFTGVRGISANHFHAVSGNTGGESAYHQHGFTPAGTVSGSVAGNVGATGARPKDVPSYIVENCFIVK